MRLGPALLVGLGACRPPAAVPSPLPTKVERVELRVLALNDFHGALRPPAGRSGSVLTPDGSVEAGGAAYLATHLERLRAEAPHSAFLAAGDLVGASPLISAVFHDEPTIAVMNELGLDLSSVGNHEFDEGPAELRRLQQGGCHPTEGCFGADFSGAEFGYLAANVLVEETGETLFEPYAVLQYDSARVAVIGMTLEGTPAVVSPEQVKGLRFLNEVETVEALLPELTPRNLDAIIVLLHEGGDTTGPFDGCEGASGRLFDVAAQMPDAVDLVIGGHTDAAHVCEIDGKLVTAAGGNGVLLTVIDLVLDSAEHRVSSRQARNLAVTRDVEPDPKLMELIASYDKRVRPLADRVVGKIGGPLLRRATRSGDSELGEVIADAQLAAGARAGSQIAFMNPGGIRADLDVDSGGDVSFAAAFAIHPFGNALVTMTLTGAEIEALLEMQFRLRGDTEAATMLQVSRGFEYTWDASRRRGDRIAPTSIKLGGKPLDPSADYRVTVNDFLATGGDGFPILATGRDRIGGPVDVDALVSYIAANPGLKADKPSRIMRKE